MFLSPEEVVEHDIRLTHQHQKLSSSQTGYGESIMDRPEEYTPEEFEKEEGALEREYRRQQGLLVKPDKQEGIHSRPGRAKPTSMADAELEERLQIREDEILRDQIGHHSDDSLAQETDSPIGEPDDL